MELFFNVNLDFDKSRVDGLLDETVNTGKKGYICVIESNNLTCANNNLQFLKVVNNSLVNVCDGSVLAMLLSKVHKRPLKPYLGAELFMNCISAGNYKHYFLGNTSPVLNGLKKNLTKINSTLSEAQFVELPFCSVDKFDYSAIGKEINKTGPDLIWVSLGAPKQEMFMSRLLPYLEKGVLVGVGAVFNFYSGVGPVKRAPQFMRNLKLEWLYRAYEEPGKNIPRYWKFVKILPKLLISEIKKVRNEKKAFLALHDKTCKAFGSNSKEIM